MQHELVKEIIVEQGLASANHMICTGQLSKAMNILSTISRIDPDSELCKKVIVLAVSDELKNLGIFEPKPDLTENFGVFWDGEDLNGRSIQIFCDQGMGDTINLLRYVRELKRRYQCAIVLNYYAFYEQFERFIKSQSYIDGFTKVHIKCDYHTNIMCLPTIMCDFKTQRHYPTPFEIVNQTEIPDGMLKVDCGPVEVGSNADLKIGVAWLSNQENELSKKKSIPVDLYEVFSKIPNAKLFCLQPDVDCPSWINPLPIQDIMDTASYIKSMDVIISVDTAVLHLAGSLGVPTYGILYNDADVRWGQYEKCVWYDMVELHRQGDDGDWRKPIDEIASKLSSVF